MTNDEAIKLLMSMKDGIIHVFDGDRMIALEMAISALQAQDVSGTNVGDLISRADAIDALDRIFDRCEEIEARLPEGDPDRTGYKMYPDYMTVWKYLHQLPSAHPESTRTFVELVARYPDPELCAYKEYKGKPYYSIKYIENGETCVGYGTYNPEVLSQYLKEYFISSAQPEIICCGECAKMKVDTVFHDCWCGETGKKVWVNHYCGYAERRKQDG